MFCESSWMSTGSKTAIKYLQGIQIQIIDSKLNIIIRNCLFMNNLYLQTNCIKYSKENYLVLADFLPDQKEA